MLLEAHTTRCLLYTTRFLHKHHTPACWHGQGARRAQGPKAF